MTELSKSCKVVETKTSEIGTSKNSSEPQTNLRLEVDRTDKVRRAHYELFTQFLHRLSDLLV